MQDDYYALTIHIAEEGTPLLDPSDQTPTGKISSAGHMWYSIQKNGDPEQTRSFGFIPKKEGMPVWQGKVTEQDNKTYYKPLFAQTMEITKEQYDNLMDFGRNGVGTEHFRSLYDIASKSCVDFVWAALRRAGGFEMNGKEIDTEGKFLPRKNREDVMSIVNAKKSNSSHNKIHEGPTAKEAQAELDGLDRKQKAEAFRENPKKALENYPGDKRLRAACTTLETVSKRFSGSSKGDEMVARMHKHLANKIESGDSIPTSRQALRMITQALGRGGIGD